METAKDRTTSVREIYLEVTYQDGEPLGAYLYLPRQEGDRSVRAEQHRAGLIADLTADGRPIGIEIGFPDLVTIEAVNEVLAAYGLEPIEAVELAPLRAVSTLVGEGPRERKLGTLKGTVRYEARDFDAPLDDFSEETIDTAAPHSDERQSAFEDLIGFATTAKPPDDAAVEQILLEERLKKHG